MVAIIITLCAVVCILTCAVIVLSHRPSMLTVDILREQLTEVRAENVDLHDRLMAKSTGEYVTLNKRRTPGDDKPKEKHQPTQAEIEEHMAVEAQKAHDAAMLLQAGQVRSDESLLDR